MKTKSLVIVSGFSIMFAACGKKEEVPPEQKSSSPISKELEKIDMPVLPVKKDDFWKYKVRVEIPAGITSEGAAAVELEAEKTRTFLGEIEISEDDPPVEAFEVVVPGQPVERELVKIREDSVMMLGSYRPGVAGGKAVWLQPAIPFVIAGLRPGQEMIPLTANEGTIKREVRVVARESIEVPAGEFATIRMLMTGNDGELEIRRTTWFAPGIGIVKEEKTRYAGEKLLFREITELVETNVKKE